MRRREDFRNDLSLRAGKLLSEQVCNRGGNVDVVHHADFHTPLDATPGRDEHRVHSRITGEIAMVALTHASRHR